MQVLKALIFDVFGTVVDWRGSIINEGIRLNQIKGWSVDWADFADKWRAGYQPAMEQVRSGARPWVKLDILHLEILETLLSAYKLELTQEEKKHLNQVWHRLLPWPDAVGGLLRLKSGFIIASLSNGNVSLLTHMAKHAGLPWDCIFSAELLEHYKPQAQAYLKTVSWLSLDPERVMMVAAHEDDLNAARTLGLKTAFVYRPLEFGPETLVNYPEQGSYDLIADDFYDLARQLGV